MTTINVITIITSCLCLKEIDEEVEAELERDLKEEEEELERVFVADEDFEESDVSDIEVQFHQF